MAQRVGSISPEEFSGRALDWLPESLVLSDGAAVTTWLDVIASSQLTASPQYVINNNVLNGYPVINSFSANRNLLNTSSINSVLAGDFTFFLIVRQTASSPLTIYLNSVGANPGGFIVSSGSSNQIQYVEWSSLNTVSLNVADPLFSVPNNVYKIFCVNVKRGGETWSRTELNNRKRFSINTPSYTTPSDIQVRFGATSNEINNRVYGRLLFFNRALTEKEETAIFRHLLFKYKI